MNGSSFLLDALLPSQVRDMPYHWSAWDHVLPANNYIALMNGYPTVEQVVGDRLYAQNARYDIDAVDLLARDDISDVMKDFIWAHTGNYFWQMIVEKLGHQIRSQYPMLEITVGKRLEDFKVGIRNANRAEDAEQVDIELDAKPGYNTPVTEAGSVRGPHVDNPRELFAAIMYCRDPFDDSRGGDFIINHTSSLPVNWKWWGKAELYPRNFREYDQVSYGANKGVLLINGINSVHSVTKRQITKHPRRLMNFIAEVRQPLFVIPKKRHKKP